MACFAEVGSRFRAAGGPYLYAREAFGRFAGIEIAWLDAVLVQVFAFGGFEAALIPVGEVKDPRRDVPFSLFTALIVTTLLYTLIQVVVMGVLAAPQRTDRPLTAAIALVNWLWARRRFAPPRAN
jgi:amino acid transporter